MFGKKSHCQHVNRFRSSPSDSLLQYWLDIDEQIAAGDDIHLRKRRIVSQVLPGKDAHITHRLVDAVALVHLDEEACHPLRRDLLRDAFPVYPGTRLLNALLV